MDYIALHIPQGKDGAFTVKDGSQLWVANRSDEDVRFATRWTEPCSVTMVNGKVSGYGKDYSSWLIPARGRHVVPVERDIGLNSQVIASESTRGQVSTYLVSRDPAYSKHNIIASMPMYDVLGTCVLEGNKSKVIGPLHVPSIRGGRMVVEITDAILTRGDEYGTFRVETSDDGQEWRPLHQDGFSEGTLIIDQSRMHTGDTYGDEFYLAGAGEYIRICFETESLAGWGFKANVTLETKR